MPKSGKLLKPWKEAEFKIALKRAEQNIKMLEAEDFRKRIAFRKRVKVFLSAHPKPKGSKASARRVSPKKSPKS